MFKNKVKEWQFLEALQSQSKAEIFLVGGAVRDEILGRQIKDYDFVVRGLELEKIIKILEKLGRVDLVGKRFGVIKFKPKNSEEIFDIALPRREFSLGFTGGYRDFEIQSDHLMPIEEDLSRRDFTVNAMAFNLNTKELVDPFFGQKDLEEKIIRTVGAAVSRFQEDYSRMLRAIRFACQLDFSISDKTKQAIQKLAPHLNDKTEDNWVVAREVISQEFTKAFDAAPLKCLELCDELNVLKTILPEVEALKDCEQSPPYHLEGNAFIHISLALKELSGETFKKYFKQEPSLLTKLGVLFHDIGKPVTASKKSERIHFYNHENVGAEMVKKICKRLTLPYRDELAWIVRHHLYSIHRQGQPIKPVELEEIFFSDRWPSESLLQVMLVDQLASHSIERIDSIAPFKELLVEIKKLAPNGTLPQALAGGDDIIKWTKLKPGPQIKSALNDLREQQLLGEILTKQEAKKYVVKKYGKA